MKSGLRIDQKNKPEQFKGRFLLTYFIFVILTTLFSQALAMVEECVDFGPYRHWIGTTGDRDFFGALDVVLMDDFAVLARPSGVVILNIEDIEHPFKVSRLRRGSYAVEVRDHLLFVGDGLFDFGIYDVSSPEAPVLISNVPNIGKIQGIYLDGNLAFLACGQHGLAIVDISEPTQPFLLSRYNTEGDTRDVLVYQQRAYVADLYGGLLQFDVSNPEDPTLIRKIAEEPAVHLLRDGNMIYVARSTEGLALYQVHNPDYVRRVWYMEPGLVWDLALDGDLLFLVQGRDGLRAIDLSDILQPIIFDPIMLFGRASGIKIRNEKVFVAGENRGLEIFDATKPMPSTWLNEIYIGSYGNRILIREGVAYVCKGFGVSLMDLSNPLYPEQLGRLNLPGAPYEIRFRKEIGFIADGPGGLFIADFSDSNNPVTIGSLAIVGDWRGIALDGDYAYLTSLDDGLAVIDISNLIAPKLCVQVPADSRISKIDINYPYAYVTSFSEGLVIYDISDPYAPKLMPDTGADGFGFGIRLYREHAFVTYGFAGLKIFNLEDPTKPRLSSHLHTISQASYMEFDGNILYLPSREAGVQVIDIKDLSEPTLIGTQATGEFARDCAVWGNYQYILAQEFLKVALVSCDDNVEEVLIDVRPNSDQNLVHCVLPKGAIPVAVLSDNGFDATTIDHTTVRFGPNEASEAHSNRHGPVRHEEDVDRDGDLDLVFHFRLADTGIQCGDTKVTLTGETFDGQPIIGGDIIRTFSKGDKGNSPDRDIRITPNPFNPQTKISFYADQPQRVRVAVYDIRGRRIVELTNQQYQVGEHSVEWRGRDSAGRAVPSGEYFFRIDIGGQVETRKAMLLR